MDEIAILGVGMHPWGKWGRSFVEYGVKAARDALADAGVRWTDVDFVAGANTVRCGYPGYVAGATFAQALGWPGVNVSNSYAACASGSAALASARAQILSGAANVALVVGADTTPKGFLAPNKGERWDDTDWLRFKLLGMTNPAYFAMGARRRMELYGATPDDFAQVKVKNARAGSLNEYARYKKAFTAEQIAASPIVSAPLRLLEICATSDGGAALVVSSVEHAKKLGIANPVRVAGISTVLPKFPQRTIEMPYFASDSAAAVADDPDTSFRERIANHAYAESGLGPEDIDFAEVYDLSSSLELDWYESIGICKRGEAEKLLRDGDTAIGGRIPVNASGGVGAFGEAVPAQAIAQVCELTWQLRGQAGPRQVADAKVGLAINYGLFGHGSCTIVKR